LTLLYGFYALILLAVALFVRIIMSVPQARVDFSLEDILSALASHPESEETNKLPLTQALEKCLLFLQANNSNDLGEFIKQEMYGYSSQPPNYRYIQLSYFDAGGQLINGLNQYSIYPLVTGVCKLELHLKNGLTLILPKQILTFLSQVSGREVDTGHVSPVVIKNLLEIIRKEIIDTVSKNILKEGNELNPFQL
jgi:hypothetical protein